MHSIWKGVISFGLVNIPVKLYPATSTKAVQFRLLHDKCRTPVKYQKYCSTCRENINQDEIVRGYEYTKGQYVIVTEEDLKNLPLKSLHSVEIVSFVKGKAIDPIFFIKPYYLVPADFGYKAYDLLRRVMLETGKYAIARVVLRTREDLALVRPYREEKLILTTMHYHDEVHQPADLPDLTPAVEISPEEMAMATKLVDNLTAEFEPEKYTSRYREALQALIDSRINNRKIAVPETDTEEKIIDLLAALRASVATGEQPDKIRANRRRGRKRA